MDTMPVQVLLAEESASEAALLEGLLSEARFGSYLFREAATGAFPTRDIPQVCAV
jgi:hypothetical protein